MRILVVSVTGPPTTGGIETMLNVLTSGLAANGHEVVVLVRDRGAQFPVDIPDRTLRAAPGLRESLRWHRWADVVVHLNFTAREMLPLLLSRAAWVTGVHTWIRRVDGSRSGLDVLKLRLLHCADRVVCVSHALAADVGGAVVIPNCYREEVFRPAAAVRDGRRVVFVGRLVSHKGVDLAVQAWDAVLPALPQAHLEIIGDGPERAKVDELIDRLGLAGSVSFRGNVPPEEVARALSSAAVAIVPSVHPEPFGLVALEALACGARVVASRAGGLPEAAGPTGYLFDNGDVEGLAAALLCALQSPWSSSEEIEVARHLDQHRVRPVVEAYLRLFDEVRYHRTRRRLMHRHLRLMSGVGAAAVEIASPHVPAGRRSAGGGRDQ